MRTDTAEGPPPEVLDITGLDPPTLPVLPTGTEFTQNTRDEAIPWNIAWTQPFTGCRLMLLKGALDNYHTWRVDYERFATAFRESRERCVDNPSSELGKRECAVNILNLASALQRANWALHGVSMSLKVWKPTHLTHLRQAVDEASLKVREARIYASRRAELHATRRELQDEMERRTEVVPAYTELAPYARFPPPIMLPMSPPVPVEVHVRESHPQATSPGVNPLPTGQSDEKERSAEASGPQSRGGERFGPSTSQPGGPSSLAHQTQRRH